MGCANNNSTIQSVAVVNEIVPQQPLEFTSCVETPEVPPKPLSGLEIGIYIVNMDAALLDCRETLQDFNDWLDAIRQQYIDSGAN